MALPFLPGNTFRDPTRTNYAKSQSLGYVNSYAVPKDVGGGVAARGTYSDEELAAFAGTDPVLTYGRRATNTMPQFIPAHVALDKMVLRFEAYFKEAVAESPLENLRVRRVNILFYLEDDTLMVMEPRQVNSGLPQGVLIKRQLVPSEAGGNVGMFDLNVGNEVTLYGKTFRISGCDAFTRDYLTRAGVAVGAPEAQPDDTHSATRRVVESHARVYRDDPEQDKLRRFLQNDRKVLRFACVWEDRDNAQGDLRPFTLNFHLADDTVEVREVHSTNDGRDPFPLLLRRNKLPKTAVDMSQIGKDYDEVYTDKDFFIGANIDVFGRRFLIYDCDAYTREYYLHHYQREMEPLAFTSGMPAAAQREIPPHTGFGTEEDSLGSVYSLQPKQPKKDFLRQLKNEGKILRFSARLVTKAATDQRRRFVISYYLADDTVGVFEPADRNSGIIGGKFLERSILNRPDTGERYCGTDFFVGAVVQLNSHRFMLTDADEYALVYMEEHTREFPYSDINRVLAKVQRALGTRSLTDVLGGADPRSSGAVATARFEDALTSLDRNLVAQELLTVERRFRGPVDNTVDYRALAAAL